MRGVRAANARRNARLVRFALIVSVIVNCCILLIVYSDKIGKSAGGSVEAISDKGNVESVDTAAVQGGPETDEPQDKPLQQQQQQSADSGGNQASAGQSGKTAVSGKTTGAGKTAGNVKTAESDHPAQAADKGNKAADVKQSSGKDNRSDDATKTDAGKPAGTTEEAVQLPTTYVVQEGDTLSTISNKFYLSKDHIDLIANANGIVFINDVSAGDRLTIPPLGAASGASSGSAANGAKDKPAATPVELPATYLVQAGDNLQGISMKFYQSKNYAALIAYYNHIENDTDLKAGNSLVIPTIPDRPGMDAEAEVASDYKWREHTIQAGESLSSISEQYYGTKDRALFLAGYNHIADLDKLEAGKVLRIPILEDKAGGKEVADAGTGDDAAQRAES